MPLSRDTAGVMSQENVEICRRLFDLFSGRDPVAGVEAALDYADPEGVLESAIIGGAEGTAYRGHDGFRQWAADVETVCAATGFSRFPVAEPDGELLGYLHIKDVIESDEERRQRPIDDKWVRPFATVSPDDLLHEAFDVVAEAFAATA